MSPPRKFFVGQSNPSSRFIASMSLYLSRWGLFEIDKNTIHISWLMKYPEFENRISGLSCLCCHSTRLTYDNFWSLIINGQLNLLANFNRKPNKNILYQHFLALPCYCVNSFTGWKHHKKIKLKYGFPLTFYKYVNELLLHVIYDVSCSSFKFIILYL